jgi:hypothetical protein
MDNRQAKEILLVYRTGTQDDRDPEIAEALEFARQNSDLQSWLHEQTAFHRAVRAELRTISVPWRLKHAILTQRKIVIIPIWRRPEFLLVAACFAAALILTTLWVWRPAEDASLVGFQKRMVGFALRLYRMDIVTNDLRQVQSFLVANGRPAQLDLTPALRQTPVKGGAALTWQGHPVGMVCFDLPKGQTLYMFVMRQSAFGSGALPGPTPTVQPLSGIMTATWSRNGHVYLIAADPKAVDLRKLIVATKTTAADAGQPPSFAAPPIQAFRDFRTFRDNQSLQYRAPLLQQVSAHQCQNLLPAWCGSSNCGRGDRIASRPFQRHWHS